MLKEKVLDKIVVKKIKKNEKYKRLICRLIFYSAFLFFLITFGTNWLYFPSDEIYPTTYKYEDIFINNPKSKNSINAWYIEAKDKFPTIVFSHGNGGNISNFFPILESAVDEGYGVLIYDYRGYWKSKGIPHEKGLYSDLDSVIKYLNSERNINNEDIILWGLSIGGGVTAEIASKDRFRGVILQSTFSNIRDMAVSRIKSIFFNNKTNKYIDNILYKIIYFVPIFQEFDTKNKIAKIESPLFILHSKEDEMIPYKLAEANYSKSKNAVLYISNTGGHNEYLWSNKKVMDFLNTLR